MQWSHAQKHEEENQEQEPVFGAEQVDAPQVHCICHDVFIGDESSAVNDKTSTAAAPLSMLLPWSKIVRNDRVCLELKRKFYDNTTRVGGLSFTAAMNLQSFNSLSTITITILIVDALYLVAVLLLGKPIPGDTRCVTKRM